ncbi:hypothetical protein NQ317_011779 [Molorchus minor]|uniref:N-acetyltransferase domain-containing protein n=1 Tax=Molorchus minor TaxID=1323400 RepID=A0ABQ9JI87_9CUCU|nr:hypothetical protein NQ317_011779 [Molorchus minor]
MPEENNDILLDIAHEDLPKLAELYKQHKDVLPYAYSMITTAIEWKKKRTEDYITLTSPNGCWRENGTIVALVKTGSSSEVYIFSLAKSNKNLYDALIHSKRINYAKLFLFACIHENLHPTVKKVLEEKNVQGDDIENFMFAINTKDALKFVPDCPPEVYIGKLNKNHVLDVNSRWPHRYRNSDKFISFLIEMNDAYGVFLKSNDELVAWILLSVMGQMAILQTKEGYERKGYASLVVKYMSKELAKKVKLPLPLFW